MHAIKKIPESGATIHVLYKIILWKGKEKSSETFLNKNVYQH